MRSNHSESSMFVFGRKIILKTCGTTTLLKAVPMILEIASSAGCRSLDFLMYSRKAFLSPEQQPWPHNQWDNEVEYLDSIFEKDHFDTSGHLLGKTNGENWCLYTCTPLSLKADENINYKNAAKNVKLEILMTELDQNKMKKFWRTETERRAAKEEEKSIGKSIVKHTFTDKRIYV